MASVVGHESGISMAHVVSLVVPFHRMEFRDSFA